MLMHRTLLEHPHPQGRVLSVFAPQRINAIINPKHNGVKTLRTQDISALVS